jgi:hypothetical protein
MLYAHWVLATGYQLLYTNSVEILSKCKYNRTAPGYYISSKPLLEFVRQLLFPPVAKTPLAGEGEDKREI